MEYSDKNRINAYFSAGSNDDEAFVSSSYLDPENEAELKELAGEHWKKSPDDTVDLHHIFDRIHFAIRSEKRRSLRVKILKTYYRVAAVLLIPIVLSGILWIIVHSGSEISYSEIRAPKGSRIQFTLPDGSTGNLNGGSRIRYPVDFRENRTIFLAGEGYFNVIEDRKHPFVVSTEHVDIQALGTCFDVCAYEEDENVYTTLNEGSVRIFNKPVNRYMILNSGEQNVINTVSGSMENRHVRTDLYTSWKDDMLRFDNALFDEVVKKMERWYGVKIVVDKSLKYSENYTMTIKTESLRELLHLLSYTTPLSYKIDKDSVMIYPLQKK